MDIKTLVSWVQILFNEPSYLEWSFSPQKIRLKAFDCPEAMGRLHIPAYFWQKKNLSRRNTLAPYAIRIFKREFWLREENAWRKQVYLIASDILVILIDLWHNNNWWLLHRKALLVYHFLAKKIIRSILYTDVTMWGNQLVVVYYANSVTLFRCTNLCLFISYHYD